MDYSNYKNVALVKYDLYTDNFNKVYYTIKKSHDKKPTEKTKELLNAMHQIALYVNSLEIDLNASNEVISTMRLDKNRAILRARKCEDKYKDLNLKL